MTDTISTAAKGAGGKHAALWERMRSQKRPQMIHRRRRKVVSAITKETTEESKKMTTKAVAIPMSITMSDDASSLHDNDESESTAADDDELMGIKIDPEPSTWAMMDYGTDKQEQLEQQETRNNIPCSLGTSFISASTTQEDNAIAVQDDIGQEDDVLIGTPPVAAAKSKAHSDYTNTPGVLWKDWQQQQEEQVQDGDLSLLQQSIISNDDSSDDEHHSHLHLNETKLSVASLENSSSTASTPIPGAAQTLLMASSCSPTSPLTAMRRNSMHQAMEESNVYVRRIRQLEEALLRARQEAKNNNAHYHYKAASQTTTSTPSNFSTVLVGEQHHATTTTTSKTTCSPLLERNKTLVKEIRFAEQTCVELSQRNVDLENEVERLEANFQDVRKEQDALHDEIVQSNRKCAALQAEKNALQVTYAKERDSNVSQILALQERLEQLQVQQQENQQLVRRATTVMEKENCETSNCSSSMMSSSELELARAHAKLASVSKELQVVRVAESSARYALSQAKVEINVLQREKDKLDNAKGDDDGPPRSDDATSRQQQEMMMAELQRMTRERQEHETAAALQASNNKVKALEDELVLSRQQAALERERLQEEFFEMTQNALGNVERQSLVLDESVKAKAKQFKSRIESLSSAVQHLQDSLDFQSETASSVSEGEEESLASEQSVERSCQARNDEDSSNGTVLNATFHQSQSGVRSIHEEMLLEKMEEARPVDMHSESVGHEVIDDLSFIADMSHLYEDLSALLMHDPMSPGRNASAELKNMSSPAIKSAGNVSSAEKSSVQCSLESVEQDFLQLRAILERAQRASSEGNHDLLGTIKEQTNVIHSLERKLGDLANEAGKSEAERRQLNVAVLEMSKAYNRCHVELRDTSEKLKASQETETEARSEIQQTLQGLLGKLQEKERSIAVLHSEKERLSATVRHLSASSEELLRARKDGKLHDEQIAKLQQEVESKATQLAKRSLDRDELKKEVESLQNLRQQHEMTIGNLQGSTAILEAAKSETEEKYNEATSILRALSREREQQKQELLTAKRNEEEIRREVAIGAETISVQKEQLENMKVERDDAVIRSTKLSRTVDELTNARSKLLLEVEQLKGALSTMEGELDYLKVSYITCNDKLADASERNANKDELVANFRSSNRAAKEVISTYEERLAMLNSELEQSESERSALKQQLVEMERELRSTTDDFASYKRGMETKLSERQDLIEVVQSTAEALKCTYEHKLAALTAEHEALEAEVSRAISDFMTEFCAAYADSLESLSQIGFTFDDGEFRLGSSETSKLPWSHSLKAASQKLPRWKQVVAECSQVILEYQGRLQQAEEKVGSLASQAHLFKDAESKIEDKLREQQHQSESLTNELRIAESNVAKSAREITEMSEAFVATKRELAHVSNLLADQKDLKEKTEVLIMEREDAESRVVEMTKTLAVLEEKLKGAVGEFARLKERIQEKDEVTRQLKSQNASLDRKCERLRDYIRKLTNKCDEWADYAEKQTQVLKKVKDRQRRAGVQVEQQTHESHFTGETPRATFQPSQADDRTSNQWLVERKMLDRVSNLVDDDNLDELASELRHFGLK